MWRIDPDVVVEHSHREQSDVERQFLLSSLRLRATMYFPMKVTSFAKVTLKLC